MTATPTVTLATGEVAPSNSPQWRDECFVRWQRVVSMRPMSIFARRAKLAEVEAEFEKDWKARKGAPNASAGR